MNRRDYVKMAAAFSAVRALGVPEPSANSTVTLKEAHKGTLEIDLRMFNQFVPQSAATNDFYTQARSFYCGESATDLVALSQQFNRPALGGPLLGDLTASGVSVWMQLPQPDALTIEIYDSESVAPMRITAPANDCTPTIHCDSLSPNMAYRYVVRSSAGMVLGLGQFVTPPAAASRDRFKIACGSDFHKIGIHRPELMNLMQKRGNRAAILAGDLVVDGRRNNEGLIRSDYLLRNLAPSWQNLAANVPVFATWDDHDYFANDAHGSDYTGEKVEVGLLRSLWEEHWNNPKPAGEGIYFSTHLGPVHLIMLDTRSCRENERQGEYGSFLGARQMKWLVNEMEQSTSPFLLISSGTMWSDYISGGKDSWRRWDIAGREEIFSLIDAKKKTRVVLLSGDRHGARGFAIPRPNGQPIYELETGSMGGVPGPKATENDFKHQLYGYAGLNFWAYGELEFYFDGEEPHIQFQLIGDHGNVLETVQIDRG